MDQKQCDKRQDEHFCSKFEVALVGDEMKSFKLLACWKCKREQQIWKEYNIKISEILKIEMQHIRREDDLCNTKHHGINLARPGKFKHRDFS